MIDWLESLICSFFPYCKGFSYFEKFKKLKNVKRVCPKRKIKGKKE